MRFTIEAHVSDGLKVIPTIPDIPLCMVEGRNGVGKTVAVQLLELVSGSIPEDFIRRPALWPSLRERLNDTSVLIEHLNGNHSLRVTFTPGDWPDSPPSVPSEWLGTATVDDQPATIESVASLLSVTRIFGDEDLEVTLRRRVETLTGYLSLAAERVRQRGGEIEKRLGGIAADLRRADPTEIGRDEGLLKEGEQNLDLAVTEAVAAEGRLTRLLHALETKLQLDAAGQESESLLAQRADLLAKISSLNEELSELERKAETAEAAFAAEGDTQRRLADAEGLLRHRNARLANLDRQVKSSITAFGSDINASSADVDSALAECENKLERLTEQYRSLDNTSLVRDLIKSMTLPLQAVEGDVGDEILVRTTDDGLTVSETLEGMNTRGRELADQPRPAELRELSSQIDEARQRKSALQELLSSVQQWELQQVRVRQAAQEATAAAEQAIQASEAAQEMREAHQAVGAAQEALTATHAELAMVQQQIGSTGATSKEDAETDLQAALQALGLDADQLANAESAARGALAEADRKVTELEAAVSTIRRRLTVRRTDIDRVIDRLQENTEYHWLWEATPGLWSQLADPQQRYRAFGTFRAAVLDSSETAYRAANLLSNLVGIAQSFFSVERAKITDPRDLVQTLRPAFEVVLGQRMRDALNSESIREALFDGAEVVRVDPSSRQLTLRDSEGGESHRSMEAFSSGERAFAFTQARIADLEVSSKPNRLLVLDEFGAYVAADRLPDLAEFLNDYVQQYVDQVLVILPLHVDYESEVAETRGELRKRYEERRLQIRDRGYCAVGLA